MEEPPNDGPGRWVPGRWVPETELETEIAALRSEVAAMNTKLAAMTAAANNLTAVVQNLIRTLPAAPTTTVAPQSEPQPEKESIKGLSAGDYYLDFKRRGGAHLNLGRQDRDRADVVVAWYDAMAGDEVVDFSDSEQDRETQRRRVGHLTDLIKEHFYNAFDALPNLTNPELKMRIPPSTKNSKEPGMNWIPDRIADLRKIKKSIIASTNIDSGRKDDLMASIDTSITVSATAFSDFRENALATNKRRRTTDDDDDDDVASSSSRVVERAS